MAGQDRDFLSMFATCLCESRQVDVEKHHQHPLSCHMSIDEINRAGESPDRQVTAETRRAADVLGDDCSLRSDLFDSPLVAFVVDSLEAAKAEDIIAIALEGKSSIAEFMIVASGRVGRHVAAIAEQLVSDLKRKGRDIIGVEGLPQADWVLVDAGDVIVHVFRPEVRSFYNLEKMWSVAHVAGNDAEQTQPGLLS